MLKIEQIVRLPNVPITEYGLDLLKECRCLYFVVKYKKILYIGKSSNLLHSWKSHSRRKWAIRLQCELYWLEYHDSENELLDLKIKHVLYYMPAWNILNLTPFGIGLTPRKGKRETLTSDEMDEKIGES